MDIELLAHLEKVRESSEKVRRLGTAEHTDYLFDVNDALNYLGAELDAEKERNQGETLG